MPISFDFPEIPTPDSFASWLWLTLGIAFGRAFGKQLDQEIQQTPWFKKLKPWEKWIVKRLLDFLHHWWIGALLMLYCADPIEVWLMPGTFINVLKELYWFGAGLLLDDMPDIPRRIEKIGNFARTLNNRGAGGSHSPS